MTEAEYNARYDYLCERRLRETDSHLHECFRSSVFSFDLLLTNYKNVFPFFTDHTFEHSEQVINYCNLIAGEDIISSLNPDEIYILLMGASLHDVGMGVSEEDFRELGAKIPQLKTYMKEHPGEPTAEYTRIFHQEFSARFIEKYSALFEIPSREHVYCISQVARGHRKADLLDETQYAVNFPLSNGQTVNLAYLAALIKLADELDVTADRNLLFDYNHLDEKYSKKQTLCYKCHGAIKSLKVNSDSLALRYDTNEEEVEREILLTKGKVEKTFSEYREVVEKRTRFKNRIGKIVFEKINGQ